MKMVHMARSAKPDRDSADSVSLDGDKYPHGLHISLGPEEMDKLGMKDTPKPGAVYRMESHARVTDAHEPADGKKEGRRVGMHITHMGAEEKADQVPEQKGGLRKDIEAAADKAGKQGPDEKAGRAQNKGKDAGARAATGRVIPKKDE